MKQPALIVAVMAAMILPSVLAQDSAVQLRTLIAATPRLPLEQVPLTANLPEGGEFGTISSVATDRNGVVYVLQRGDKADPVIAVNREGKVLHSWGKGMFTVPHGIRVDSAGNIWTADAGSSMILKFSPEGKKLQEISVGEVATGKDCFTPILCGTTDLTFGPNGRIFISDGYGNGRILEYNAAGKRVNVWGSKGSGPGQFQVPHGIANNGNVLYVADRQNARIQRFDLDGKFLGEWTHLGRPFALKVSGGALWVSLMTLEPAAQGQTTPGQSPRSSPFIFKVDLATGRVLGQIKAPGPHSIDVNTRGELFTGGCCGGSNPMGFFWLRVL